MNNKLTQASNKSIVIFSPEGSTAASTKPQKNQIRKEKEIDRETSNDEVMVITMYNSSYL